MKVNEFLSAIESNYKKYFPSSKIVVKLNTSFYASIGITLFIAGDRTEVYNGIWENDMLSVRFSISTDRGEFSRDITAESELPENLNLKVWDKHYMIKPKSQYLVYDSRKLSFRQTKGDSKKLLTTLDKYFKKLQEQLKEDLKADLIHDNHRELLISKLQ